MTLAGQSAPLLLLISGGILVGGLVLARWLSQRLQWRPAGALCLLAVVPLIPHVDVAFGFSLDDVLPIAGILLLLQDRRLRDRRALRPPLAVVVGLALMIGAASLSSIANGVGPSGALTMFLRSAGRDGFLAVIGVLVALVYPTERRWTMVAMGLAAMGTIEAILGLIGFFLPLGGLFLEPTRQYSVLYLEVPGRLAGTLGISPNFLGAIFILTILMAAGLALEAQTARLRLLLWASVVVQFLALTLTFTRASLGIAIVAVGILLLLGRRPRVLIPIGLIVVLASVLTPAVSRLTADVPDRFALWEGSARMMVDHPLTGVGPGRTVEVAQSDPARYMQTNFGTATNSAHNTILYAGAETGIFGALGSILINLGLALAALRMLLRARRHGRWLVVAAALGTLGYLAQGMVNNLFSVAVAGEVFALVVGAFLLETRRPDGDVEPAVSLSASAPRSDPLRN